MIFTNKKFHGHTLEEIRRREEEVERREEAVRRRERAVSPLNDRERRRELFASK